MWAVNGCEYPQLEAASEPKLSSLRMRESELRELVWRLGPRMGCNLSVASRRLVLKLADAHDLDVWVCEACGEAHEEGLAAYFVERHTRLREGSITILCGACVRHVPVARVVSD